MISMRISMLFAKAALPTPPLMAPTLAAFVLLVIAAAAAPAWAAKGDGPKEPRSIYSLRAYHHESLERSLSQGQFEIYGKREPDALRSRDPEVYGMVLDRVRELTDAWTASVREQFPVGDKDQAAFAARVEIAQGVLGELFAAEGWQYTPLEVVLVPRQVFNDPRHRRKWFDGFEVEYYPGAYFVGVDDKAPVSVALVHQTLRLNRRIGEDGVRLGRPFQLGIAECLARHLVDKHALESKKALRRADVYAEDRVRVELILDALVDRGGLSREQAIYRLVGTYLSGNAEPMVEILGHHRWERLVEMSFKKRDWYPSPIEKLLR
ncbi:hypothetical protein ABI59_09585 [Acidobacteria bacterium Mor1]|nr:hypothetical protein ABI59_09585 [Acidobacteria bacterium Mor1]